MQLPLSPLYTTAPQPAVPLQVERHDCMLGRVEEAAAGSARSVESAVALEGPAVQVVPPMNG